MRALPAHGGFRSVTWPQAGFIGQRQDFGLDPMQELAPAAAREIGAPHAVAKKHIAPEEEVAFRLVEAEAIQRVARDVEHLPKVAERLQRLGLAGMVRHLKRRDTEGQACGQAEERFQREIPGIVGEGDQRAFKPLHQSRRILAVIKVLMGQPERLRGDPQVLDPSCHSLRGIDDQMAVSEGDEISVGGGDAAGVALKSEH